MADGDRWNLPPALRNFCIGSLVLLTLCLGSEFLCRHVLGMPQSPFGLFAFERSADYIDITMFRERFRYFHSPDFFTAHAGNAFLYPAPAALIYAANYAVAGLNHHPFLIFIAAVFGFAAWLFYGALRRRGLHAIPAGVFVVACLLLSYPCYFVFNRANIEIVVWGVSALGVVALVRNRPWLAAALFGIAGSIKLYPVIYLGLLLSRKEVRQAMFGGLVLVATTVLSLLLVTPNLVQSARGTATGLAQFGRMYGSQRRAGEIGFDHSLVGLVKRFLHTMPPEKVMSREIKVYLVLVALAGCLLYLRRIRHSPFINQVLCLTVACILLPPTSYDYTLLHLYLPWALLVLLAVKAYVDGRSLPRGFAWAFACFVVLLSPENEFILHGERFGGQIKAVALTALFGIALRFPFRSEFDPRSERATV